MIDGEFFVDYFLEIGADVAEPEVQALQGLELGCYACGEGADCDVADVAEEVLNAYFFGFFGFDYGGGMHEGFGCCGAVLGNWGGLVSMVEGWWEGKRWVRGEGTSFISSTAK